MVEERKQLKMLERLFDTCLYAMWFIFGYTLSGRKKDKSGN